MGGSRSPSPGRSGRTGLASAIMIVTVADLSLALVLIALAGDRAGPVSSIRLGEALALLVPWVTFTIVGRIIVAHRPDNTIGWLCSIGGLQVSMIGLAVGLGVYGLAAQPPLLIGTAAAWVSHSASITIVVVPLLIAFRFPTGQPIGPWWRRVERVAVAYVGVMVLVAAIDPMPLMGFPGTANPVRLGETSRVTPLLFGPAIACAGLAAVSLVIRFRDGSALERRQIRLLAIASVLVGLAMATMPVTSPDLLSGGQLSTLTTLVNAVAFTTVPVAIGVAIVRDRLYDIDHVVNRTLVYSLVSAILAVIYVVSVVSLGGLLNLLSPGAGTAPATAVSTLLVAALFRPVRARAQAAIDRRFDRGRYEAARTIDAFASAIRGEVELVAIAGDLRRAAMDSVRPASAACWIRHRPQGAGSRPAGTGRIARRPQASPGHG